MDKAEIQKIVDECFEKTRIVYNHEGSFFLPKLGHVNHLQAGRSRIISSKLTILLEKLFVAYHKFKDGLQKLWKKIFPRREKIYGSHMDDSLVGKIVFAKKQKVLFGKIHIDKEIPIRLLHVEFWARTRLYQWRKLSEGHTDNEGMFKLPFDLRAARAWSNRKYTRFEIYQTTHIVLENDKLVAKHDLIKTIKISKKEFIGMAYNLRTIPLSYWEYRDDTTVPRAYMKDQGKDAPEHYAEGRIETLGEQIIPIELTKVKHLMQIKRDPESISLHEIQQDYPENLTVCIEKRIPGYTRSDEWFGERMMNGMNMATFIPDKENPEHYWAKYFGSCHYPVNDDIAFPTAEIKFRLDEDHLPLPIEIHLTGPLNALNNDPWQKHVFTPANGEKWLQAKRVSRVTAALCAELDQHLSGTHLNTEQYSIAIRRNLRHNPIASLLIPHTKAVSLINNTADDILIKGYIATATAMPPESSWLRARDVLGFQDWKGWKPMAEISPAHRYAKIEKIFYDIVSEFVDHFINENLEGIKKGWSAIYRFSNDLVEHAVPLFHSTVDLDKLSAEERAFTERRMEYLTAEFRLDLSLTRSIFNGEVKVVSPICSSEVFDPGKPEELQNLRDICKYIIMTATLIHTWVNKHQYEDIGEVLYSCLGLRFGEKESGIMAPESDLSIAPDLTRSTQMMWFSNLLSRTGYGFIVNDEEGDIDPHFVEMLLAKKDAFDALKFDITQVASRTNI
ncbi:MAG: hypothetical protein IPO83_09825 [Chitinophagaceae bacterium]|nr:hypothetical protein [Chitinophagaceae bacterium]